MPSLPQPSFTLLPIRYNEGSKEPTKPHIVFVAKDSVKVQFNKPQLETQQDVEDYIETLKKQYLRIINENKRISL